MISVIIPVYNVEKYLEKCLRSVVSNTYHDLEIICVNDGSTDSSPDILKKWRLKDPRIIIVNHENRGLPEARNSGLEIATGEYITFIDADDLIHPQFFQLLLQCMEKTDADMVICGVQRFETDEDVEINPVPELQFKKLTKKELYNNMFNKCMIWGRLLRRRDTETLRFPSEVDALQDTLYNLKLIKSLKKPLVYCIEVPLYFYLQRSDSLSKKRAYYEPLEMVGWYVKNERDPLHKKSGEWGCLLLFHSISVTLSCRYQAYLLNDQEIIERTNALLRVMMSDMLRDKTIGLIYKAAHIVWFLFPYSYRRFREYNGTALKV